MATPSNRLIRRRSAAFCSAHTPEQLAALLSIPQHQLALLGINPVYRHFAIPKRDGSQRFIEDPEPQLKKVQRSLNLYLQSVYFFLHPDPAYGFMINVKDDPLPRNILTHARRHLGCRWLYNADIEDFFHRIYFQKVYDIFASPPFQFEAESIRLLASLCTYQERLPMGAPTSPILSNFVAREMDEDLESLAQWAGWTYTRFADDMSFSSFDDMAPDHLAKIEAVVQSHGFEFNPAKVKLAGPDDPKTVTGLRLEETVKLPAGFFADLEKEIEKFSGILALQPQLARKTSWVKQYHQQIEGALSFAAFVAGHNHPAVVAATDQLDQALHPEISYGALSWMEFGYM